MVLAGVSCISFSSLGQIDGAAAFARTAPAGHSADGPGKVVIQSQLLAVPPRRSFPAERIRHHRPRLAESNDLKGVIDVADFKDADKLGKGEEIVDR